MSVLRVPFLVLRLRFFGKRLRRGFLAAGGGS